MTEERAKGVADAIRVIKAMGHEWPDAIGLPPSDQDRYGQQFVNRILEYFPQAEQFVPYGSRKSNGAVPPQPVRD